MKKNIKYLFIIFLLLLGVNKVDALSLSKTDITIEKGTSDTVELYANVEENVTSVDFTLVFSTYDVPAYFTVNPEYTDGNPNGIKHNINFDEPVTGKILLGTIRISPKSNPTVGGGTVSIHTGSAKNEVGENITLNAQNLNITIGTPTEEPVEENNDKDNDKEPVDTNLLDKIESKIVKINLKKDIFEYTINIESDIKELDLKPIAKDQKTQVEITTQKIEELVNNEIIITTKNGDVEQKYTIKVSKTKEEIKTEIDNEEFKSDNSYKTKWIITIIIFGVLFIVGLGLTKKSK